MLALCGLAWLTIAVLRLHYSKRLIESLKAVV